MAKCEIATGLSVCKISAHMCQHIFFSVRSRASMVDGDAIVEKLNRSDGNSRPYTWLLTTYVYAYVHLTHSWTGIFFFFLYMYICTEKYDAWWDLMNTAYQSWRDFNLLMSRYRNVSYFRILWFLAKYLHIIYDGNLDEAIRSSRMEWRNISIFFKPITKHWFSKFYGTLIWNMSSLLLHSMFKTCVFNMGTFRSSQAISFVI